MPVGYGSKALQSPHPEERSSIAGTTWQRRSLLSRGWISRCETPFRRQSWPTSTCIRIDSSLYSALLNPRGDSVKNDDPDCLAEIARLSKAGPRLHG